MAIKPKTSTAKSKSKKIFDADKFFDTSLDEIGDRLAENFRKNSVIAKDLILPSGQIGHHYIDTKHALYGAEAGMLANLGILKSLMPGVSQVGGISSNATSLATGVIQLAFLQGRELNSFLVRKEPRKYGKSQWVEGPIEAGNTVCMIEDVLLDGENIIKAIRRVQDEFGVTVVQVIAVLDRQEGGKKRIEELGIEVTTLCSIEEIIDVDR